MLPIWAIFLELSRSNGLGQFKFGPRYHNDILPLHVQGCDLDPGELEDYNHVIPWCSAVHTSGRSYVIFTMSLVL